MGTVWIGKSDSGDHQRFAAAKRRPISWDNLVFDFKAVGERSRNVPISSASWTQIASTQQQHGQYDVDLRAFPHYGQECFRCGRMALL